MKTSVVSNFSTCRKVLSPSSQLALLPQIQFANNEQETYNTQDPGLNMFLGGAVGAKVTSITKQISNGSQEMDMAAQASSGNGCAGIKTTEYEFVELSVTDGGNYNFQIDVDNQGGKGYVTLYEKDTFDPNSPCVSFVKSSARSTGQGSVLSYNDSFNANLFECRQYILAFYNDGDYPVETIVSSITGEGDVLSSSGGDSQNFSFTYIAVDQFTGLIDLISDDANFITLLPGEYNIYGAYYKSGGPTPPDNIDPNSWLGKTPEAIYAEGQCGVFSSNFKPITILSTCSINPNVTIAAQSACDPNSNLYTQTLVVNYAMNPTTGKLVVNEQEFDITGSPQTIVLTGLLSDSEPVDLELYFSEDPQCFQFLSEAFSASDNCCPFDIELEEFFAGCVGEIINLNTGVSGADHIWFKNGNEITGETGQSIDVDSDGVYTVEVRNATGCLRISEAEVSFSPLPEIDLGDAREVCGAGTRRVNADTDASTIEWYIDDVLQPDEAYFYIPIFDPGEYKAIVQNSFGCISSDSVELTVLPTPEINFDPSTFLCEGSIDTLDAGIGDTYRWTFKGDTLAFQGQFLETFEEAGIYTVTVTNEYDCLNTGQTVVLINDNPTVSLSPSSVSICELNDSAELIADPEGATELQWFFNGEEIPNANGFAINASQAGTYQFLATSNFGCTVIDSIIVSELATPEVDIPLNQFICGTSLELSVDPTPGANYAWSIGANILQTGPNANYVATEEATYSLEVTSADGCIQTGVTIVEFGEEVQLELGPDVIACNENLNLSNVSSTFNVQWFKDGIPDSNGSGNTYFANTSGLVLAIAENTDGCTATDSMQYTNFLEPDYDYPEELTLCIGTDFSFDLENSSGFDLRWFRDNVEIAFNQNPLEIMDSGLYRVDFESGLGCDYSFETDVEFVIGPDLTLVEDTFEGCDGQEFTIVAATSGDIIEWQQDGITIPGETGNTLDVTEPGTYTVIAGGIGDCDIEQNAVVTIGETPIVELGDDVSSCGDTTIVLSGPIGSFDYQWFVDGDVINGETSIELTVEDAGNYSLEVSGGGNCNGTDEILVEIGMPPTVEILGSLGICNGQSTTLMAQSSASQYQWFLNGVEIPNAISDEIIVDQAGEYSVSTNPGSSCSSEDMVEVVEGMGAPVSIGDNQIACANDEIVIEADVIDGTFEWFLEGQVITGEDGNSISVTEEGNYQLNVTDDSGCLSTATMTASFVSQAMVSIPSTYSYCLGGSATLEATIEGGPIAWYLDGNLLDETTETITVTTPGIYSIEVGADDCSAEASTIVSEDSDLSVDLGPDRMVCLTDGFMLDAGGGAMDYTWTLEGNSLPFDTPTITPTVTGIYTVMVSVSADCSATDEVTIEVDPSPMLLIQNTEVAFCIGETYVIETISDGANFRWYEDGSIINGETENSLEVSTSAIYTCETWFDNEDCAITEDVEVLVQNEPDVDLGPDQEECEGTEIILTAGNSGTEYTWYRNNVPIAEDVNEIEVTESGTYRVEVSAGPNCQGSDEVEITLISTPELDLPTSSSFCTDDVLFLEADGFAANFQWSLDGDEISGETDESIIISMPGIYTLEAFNDPACPIIYEVEVIETNSPNIDLGDISSICFGESLILDAGDIGQDYSWFLDGNPIGGNESTLEITDEGVYSVNVSAGADCEGEDEIEITVAELPIIVLPDDTSICDGQSFTIEANVSGGSNFNWYFDGTIIDDENETTIEVDAEGEYTFEAFDNPNCGSTSAINIMLLDAPMVDLGDDVFECEGEEITIDAGNPDANHQWFLDGIAVPGATDQTFDITESGTYSVEVSAGLDCAGEDEIIIDFSGFPEIDLMDEAEFCTGSAVTLSADSEASSYQWYLDGDILNGETSAEIEVTEAGEYLVEAYNNIDCPSEAMVTVIESVIPEVDLGADQSLCSGETTSLSTSVDGISYQWYLDGVNLDIDSDEIEVEQSGTYAVVVVISTDCESTDEIEIDISDAPEIILPEGESICDGESITITADSEANNFQWYLDGNQIDGETNATIDISSPGAYSVDAFNNPDCTTTEEITIGEGASPVVDLGNNTTICPEGSLELDAGEHDLYTWSDGTNQQILFITSDLPSSESTETYSVTVTNGDNCSTVDEIELTFLPVVNASIAADITNLCDDETAEITASGGDSYSWNNPNNSLNTDTGNIVTADPETTTTYVVTVTDDECTDNESTASITINIASTNIIATQDTCIFNGQEITLNVSGGATYIWDDDDSITSSTAGANITVSPSETTTYRVTILDTNGCDHERFIEVCVNPSPEETIKFVTIMTPNGDGDNDVLEFNGLEDFPLNILRIYNRWGVRVYERSFYQNDGERFDGTRNGEILPAGIYYYILEFEGFEIKKTLTIIKE